MALTPDEIAHRAFTPSVDGYHQGEVRAFLERVAAQIEGLLAVLPEGRGDVAELATALRDHEPRMNLLNEHLHGVLAELQAATAAVRETQAEAETYLLAAKELATEHAAATLPGRVGNDAEPDPATLELLAEHRTLLERLATEHSAVTEQLDTARKLTAEQREAAEHLANAGQQQNNQLDTAGRLVDKHAAAFAAGGRLVARLSELGSTTGQSGARPAAASTGHETSAQAAAGPATGGAGASAPERGSDTVTSPSAPPAAPRKSASVETLSLLGSDIQDQPLFSDNANDLLDGVLDDVMGNLTDEGDPK